MNGEQPQRGAHVLRAVVDVIAERGLEAATMRNVAAAAGISLAQVQYYFRSKDELVAAAFQHISELFELKLATVDLTAPPRRVLRQALELWLPLDDSRARDARIWLAFTAAAATSPALREIAATTDYEQRTALARALDAAAAAGELPEVTDTETEAAVLLAVVDGLTIQALALPAQARPGFIAGSLDAHLNRLFTV
ncbi:TetR/AcrR family transcriptional regulator [Kribbella sp. NPDC023855]|uniref:TetR/AcrR family transcriptional regulator n=1 Tax=Kribbella sp. NPDC023855 TaxID=3154698 RepID=UPI0033ED7A90